MEAEKKDMEEKKRAEDKKRAQQQESKGEGETIHVTAQQATVT